MSANAAGLIAIRRAIRLSFIVQSYIKNFELAIALLL
jgi:hypothetical protein